MSVPAVDLHQAVDRGLSGLGARIAEALAAAEGKPPHKALQRVDKQYESLLMRFDAEQSPL